jgi:hypothetical protein
VKFVFDSFVAEQGLNTHLAGWPDLQLAAVAKTCFPAVNVLAWALFGIDKFKARRDSGAYRSRPCR